MSAPFNADLYVRAYTEKPGSIPVAAKPARKTLDEPSPWTIIFDTETTIDAAQRLRIGFCQVRKYGKLVRELLFYGPELPASDMRVVRAYAAANGLTLATVDEFRRDVFLKIGYRANAAIVGFNLPFDISRIASGQSEARGSMRGGFSFELSHWKSEPNIRVKHLSASAALMDFAKPGKQQTGKGMRNRGFEKPHNRGYFIDVKTIAMALTSRKHSLKSLSAFLNVPTQKLETEEHGGPITDQYLEYARADVQATWECYDALSVMYASHGLETPLHRILSEASIGKAYLKQMGVVPLLGCQPDIPREGFGRIISAYFGGRAEVRIRREVSQVLYCDFKSMYPTVNALMGLNSFVIAEGYSERSTTDETQAFLDSTTLADLQDPATWVMLHTLVRLCPDDDALPVRTRYSEGRDNLTIGLNHLTSATPLWYTLADVLASKMLTGKMPRILKAITFEPGPRQSDLKPINLFGREAYRIDPNTEDMFTRLVDMRDEAKARRDPLQQQIKIIANSTCYGIFVEINRDDAPQPEPLDLYCASGERTSVMSAALEEPGRYFHPLLATLITGAARLMLALSERLAADQGMDWTFCDTDSIAMAKPEGKSDDAFNARCQAVIDWFEPLNPYRQPGSILKIEDVNYGPTTKVLTPLYCFAISAKRYALFNIDKDGKPVIRKASAHGLGAFMAPYGANKPAKGLLEPVGPLGGMGISRWQYDYWFRLIEAALNGTPNQVPLDYHARLSNPALRRYGATSPALLRWMKCFNAGKAYPDQVKPFGFMVAPIALPGPLAEMAEPEFVDPCKRGRPCKTARPKPIAPFERDGALAGAMAFDRVSGEPVEATALKTYAEALGLFHLSPEDKFENGEPWDVGRTERRHVVACRIQLIGKEANRVGPSGEPDPTSTTTVTFTTHNEGVAE
ncbi:hypothetical protein [Hyphomonas sp.]|uniref:hypothetical protein n=1 Tax=Hyphomonas sp. TaxID=87 RepID=UPI003F72457B